jgi:hypothetical protein
MWFQRKYNVLRFHSVLPREFQGLEGPKESDGSSLNNTDTLRSCYGTCLPK